MKASCAIKFFAINTPNKYLVETNAHHKNKNSEIQIDISKCFEEMKLNSDEFSHTFVILVD